MPAPHPNGDPPPASQPKVAPPAEGYPDIAELIADAEALRASLQESVARLARLIAGLKQHRRHSQAMRAAVRSLRQLRLDT